MPPSSDLVRVKQFFPLTGKGATAVSHLVLKILETDKLVQKITLEVGKPVIIETLVPKDSDLAQVVDPHDVIRNKPMTEYVPEGPPKPLLEQLAEMFRLINDENLIASHLLVGDETRFKRALKLPLRTTRLFGVPIQGVPQVPGDVFILCGALEFPAEIGEITMSVKGALP